MPNENSALADHPWRFHNGTAICLASYERDAGRTTTTANLAGELAFRGQRIVVIDADPDSGLTRRFSIELEPHDPALSEFLQGGWRSRPVRDWATPTCLANVEIIPARPELAHIDEVLENAEIDISLAMTPIVRQLRTVYDFILIDTGPEPTTPATFCSLAASDYALVVAGPEGGTADIIGDIDIVREESNPGLRLLGVLANRVPRSEVKRIEESLAEFGRHNGMLRTHIRRGGDRIPRLYAQLADELLDKIRKG